MKRTFALVLTVVLMGVSAYAQDSGDSVLARGKPPLTTVLADQLQIFFEWALDSRFNKAQRQTLNKLLIEEWKSGNQSEIDETLKLMRIPGNLNKLSTDDQKLFHDKVQPALLAQIQKEPDDTLCKLLLEVRKSHDPLNLPSNGIIPQRNNSNSSTNASNLAGEWLYRIRGSSITYTNGAGGYADPSGELSGYKLRPNGTYEHGYLLSSSLYGCNTKIFGFETGTWSVQGDKLIFQDKTATLTSKDTCNASGNYQKKRDLGHYFYSFRLERDEYGLKIVFLKTDGGQDPYYKQDPGQMGW